jgi:hypothetical protein
MPIPLKHLGLAFFPVTSSFRFSVPDMFEEHSKITETTAFFEPDGIECLRLGNRSKWHNKINLFHRRCGYRLCKFSEIS